MAEGKERCAGKRFRTRGQAPAMAVQLYTFSMQASVIWFIALFVLVFSSKSLRLVLFKSIHSSLPYLWIFHLDHLQNPHLLCLPIPVNLWSYEQCNLAKTQMWDAVEKEFMLDLNLLKLAHLCLCLLLFAVTPLDLIALIWTKTQPRSCFYFLFERFFLSPKSGQVRFTTSVIAIYSLSLTLSYSEFESLTCSL